MQRYALYDSYEASFMDEDDDGDWIRFDDANTRIEALERENAWLRDINATLEDCMSKGMVIRKKETA